MRAEQVESLLRAAERYALLLEQLVTNGAVLVEPGQALELQRLRNLLVTCKPPESTTPHGMADKGGNVR